MTAYRFRKTDPLENSAVIDVLLSGITPSGVEWFSGRTSRFWRPPTDVYETEEQFVVQMEIGGMNQADFSLAVQEQHLVVAGERRPASAAQRAYYQMEIRFGEFRCDVELPAPVQEDRVTAEYDKGILRVILPKRRSQRVDVK